MFDLVMLLIYVLIFYFLPKVSKSIITRFKQVRLSRNQYAGGVHLREVARAVLKYIDDNIDLERERQFSTRVVWCPAALLGIGLIFVIVFNFGAWQQRQKTEFLVLTESPSRAIVWIDEDEVFLLSQEQGETSGPLTMKPLPELGTAELQNIGPLEAK